MALLIFYDCTETDKAHLSEFLRSTDHHWEFIDGAIAMENLHPEAEVVSLFVSSTLTREMIAAMPRLRLVACRSTGFNNVDFAAAQERDITVTNVPSYGEHTVAEFTFSLILALSRKLVQTTQAVQDAQVEPLTLRGFDLHKKTLGIVGTGRIGQQVIRIAKGLGMGIIAYDPFPKTELADELGFAYKELSTVMAESDVISLHAPYTPANHHLISSELLSKCKHSAILINTARGELVDTGALIDALQEHKLAGAGLDVLEGEGLIDIDEELMMLHRSPSSRELLQQSTWLRILEKMPNVIITPHNAYNTEEAIRRINETTAQNIIRYWYGEVPNKVQPPTKPMGKLILARHAESEWNAKGVWTGTTDVHLTEKGFHESALLGQALGDLRIDYAYASQQIRSFETLEGILDASQQFDVPYERVGAINERDYGDYTGKNKWEVRDLIGQEAFDSLRRGWNYPVPNGETLKMVYERAVPFYVNVILPRLQQGQNVLIVAHGNSLRALMKYLESISDENIANLEMPFGNILIYQVDAEGHAVDKEERKIDTTPPPA